MKKRECPICNEPFEYDDKKRGRPPTFCSPRCRLDKKKMNTPLTALCQECGKSFVMEKGRTTYCSDVCLLQSGMEKRKAVNSRCQICHSTDLRKGAHFCSVECTQEHFDSIPEEKRKICPECGNPVPFTPELLRRQKKFCNDKCRESWVFTNRPEEIAQSVKSRRPRRRSVQSKARLYTFRSWIGSDSWAKMVYMESPRKKWDDLHPMSRGNLVHDGWTQEEWDADLPVNARQKERIDSEFTNNDLRHLQPSPYFFKKQGVDSPSQPSSGFEEMEAQMKKQEEIDARIEEDQRARAEADG